MNNRFKFRAWVVGHYFSENNEEKEILIKLNNVSVYNDGTIGIDYHSLLESVCSFLKVEGERESLLEYFENKNCTTGDDWYYLEAKFIEQCTGLKDNNGRLIYEGDIVIWNDGGGECELKPKKGWVRIAEVKLFPDLHFKIIGCYPKRTCEIGHEFHFGNFIYTETEKHLKIIGNIHENPELLEGKK